MAGLTRIACIYSAPKPVGQALLAGLCRQLLASQIKVVGVIEQAHSLADRTCSAGLLRDIVSGERHSIYLDVLPPNTSCHIDPEGARRAGAGLLGQIGKSDLVVLSKFGKLEAGGAGLRDAFDAAMAAGKPLLTTVSANHFDAWRALVPSATILPAELQALQAWSNAMVRADGAAPQATRAESN